MPGSYLLGIDCGTESVRVGIFTTDGSPLVFASRAYSLHHPHPGWAEQYPDEWWTSLVAAVRQALDESQVPPEEIVGLSADTTSCTVVALDAREQVMRPAIIWMDVRAADQARRIAASGHRALKYNGFGSVSAEWLPCKALWLKENEPEVYRKAARICEFIDWLTHRLTGQWSASINTASIRCYYDRAEGGWQTDFFEQIGLEDLVDKLPSPVLDMGTVVGGLRGDVAQELGLRPDIPVAEGGADALVAMIGLDVVTPGKMAFITGSSHLCLGQSAAPLHAKGIFGAYTDAVLPGQYTVEGGQISTGSVIKWFKDQFCGLAAEEAGTRGVDVYTVLNKQAAQIPPGSEGLVLLDYWQGNRTPYTDPEARGIIWGLSLSHTPAHIFRAIMEGVAYGTEHILRVFRENGFQIEEMVACGGPVKSRLWMQIHADVSNVPIAFTKVSEAATLGSAILGAVGAGVYPSVQDAAAHMVQRVDRIEPNEENHHRYQIYVDSYIDTYPRLEDLIHRMVRHVASET